jgi:hypothetical protein
MMVGQAGPLDQATLFEAVIEYVWVHSAELETVAAIESREDLPVKELRMIGFEIPVGEAMKFIEAYKGCAERMTASLAETVDEEAGPGKLESPPVGSPALSLHLVERETPLGSDTSSGSCPSNGPLPTFMQPTSPTEQPADGSPSLTEQFMEFPPHTQLLPHSEASMSEDRCAD